MKILYSASANGFFDGSINYPVLPPDLVETSQEIRDEFLGGRPGYEMKPGEDGGPKWEVIPEPSQEQLVSQAEENKRSSIEAALQAVAVLQLKLQAGRKLSDVESKKLNAVLDYIDAVSELDASTAPDIDWPAFPA